MMGMLEHLANEEYECGRYHPEKGGPALARLNRFRKDGRLTKFPKDPVHTPKTLSSVVDAPKRR